MKCYVYSAEDKSRWWAIVSVVMNLQVAQNAGNHLVGQSVGWLVALLSLFTGEDGLVMSMCPAILLFVLPDNILRGSHFCGNWNCTW
jgi:hypothetical protein